MLNKFLFWFIGNMIVISCLVSVYIIVAFVTWSLPPLPILAPELRGPSLRVFLLIEGILLILALTSKRHHDSDYHGPL